MKSIVTATLMLLCAESFASKAYPTKIREILVGPSCGNKVFIVISTEAHDVPDCSENPYVDYVFDVSTGAGKTTLSAVLTAYSAQKQVNVAGTGTCLLDSDVEDLKQIHLI